MMILTGAIGEHGALAFHILVGVGWLAVMGCVFVFTCAEAA